MAEYTLSNYTAITKDGVDKYDVFITAVDNPSYSDLTLKWNKDDQAENDWFYMCIPELITSFNIITGTTGDGSLSYPDIMNYYKYQDNVIVADIVETGLSADDGSYVDSDIVSMYYLSGTNIMSVSLKYSSTTLYPVTTTISWAIKSNTGASTSVTSAGITYSELLTLLNTYEYLDITETYYSYSSYLGTYPTSYSLTWRVYKGQETSMQNLSINNKRILYSYSYYIYGTFLQYFAVKNPPSFYPSTHYLNLFGDVPSNKGSTLNSYISKGATSFTSYPATVKYQLFSNNFTVSNYSDYYIDKISNTSENTNYKTIEVTPVIVSTSVYISSSTSTSSSISVTVTNGNSFPVYIMPYRSVLSYGNMHLVSGNSALTLTWNELSSSTTYGIYVDIYPATDPDATGMQVIRLIATVTTSSSSSTTSSSGGNPGTSGTVVLPW